MRCFLAAILTMSSVFGQTNVQRPHLLGVAHIALLVSDLDRTSAFYENVLGNAEPFSLSDENGKTSIALVVDLVNFYSKCVPD
jgi:catechol-2,3-dioxygenase